MLKYAINFEDDEVLFWSVVPICQSGNFRRNPQGRNPLRQRRDGNNLRPFCT